MSIIIKKMVTGQEILLGGHVTEVRMIRKRG